MKMVTKCKLPKWVVALLPYGEEEEALSSIVVPFVLFSIIGLGIALYQFCGYLSVFLGIVITGLTIGLVLCSVWWLIVQTDILHNLRLRQKTHYTITADEEEKLRTKKKLLDLCVNV